jgi:hypothetical protein
MHNTIHSTSHLGTVFRNKFLKRIIKLFYIKFIYSKKCCTDITILVHVLFKIFQTYKLFSRYYTVTQYSHTIQSHNTATPHSHTIVTQYSHTIQPHNTATPHSHTIQPHNTATTFCPCTNKYFTRYLNCCHIYSNSVLSETIRTACAVNV